MSCLFKNDNDACFLDFGPSLKRLLANGIYLLYLVSSVLAFTAFTVVITYTPKYLEQQFGQSASKTNFLIGNSCHVFLFFYVFLFIYYYLFFVRCLN